MKKIIQLFVTGLFLIHTSLQSPIFAVTETSDVSASVPSSTFYGPTLISPPDNHATNSARTSFIWKRPSPLPESSTLHHYDLFIDDSIFASNVPDSLTSQDFYFYTASASSGYFYIALKQDQTQGYHTWRVAVYDDLGQNTATGNWTYYIDSVAPFISLTKINSATYTWDTSVSGSIPEESERYITVTGNSPKLSGKVETSANFQFSLICPSGAPASCSNQSWVSNSTDGNWEQQLTNLTANINYTVQLSATDASNNTTIFPTFYLKYTTTSPTSTTTATTSPTATLSPTLPPLTSTPTQTPLPTTSITLTPPPDLAAQITPTPFISKTPPAPTPPPRKQAAVVEGPNYLNILLIILLCLGLPTHLVLSGFGLDIKMSDMTRFIFIYAFPFLRRHNAITRNLSKITLYDAQNPQKPLYETLSDIKGEYFLPTNLPNLIFVRVKKIGFIWKDQIINKNVLHSSCLCLYPKKMFTEKEKLQAYTYNNIRPIPLTIALMTSLACLYFLRNAYTGVYLYLTLQYIYSEYFYLRSKTK